MTESNAIHISGMAFYAYHGVLPEEEILGQRFIVDVDIYLNEHFGTDDNLANTVNYAEVYMAVKDIVLSERYQLIETLAEKIAADIIARFTCNKVRVEVHKPNAPVPGIFKDISVEVIRERSS
ncbi:dihydroneopterin aldolase [Dehalobacter sp. DCM]|uniref:dihydroneopterin aldolase n=1 Tax=Dehalobacter sp. DCM TaxID=2907827 RepID=UPI0030818A0E|nr:dihydroneopterin aldolase [Dehalobacter sp. DCM]